MVSGSQIIIDDSLSSPAVARTAVTENVNDTIPFADAYNVGAYGSLKKSGLGKVVDGIKLSADETLKANVISFSSSTGLGQLSGTAVIEGYDFSDYDFVVIYENLAREGSRILFRNCKFGSFKKGTSSIGTSVPFEFERCTLDAFVGANASFSECYVTGMSIDELRSGKNITISGCVFADGSQVSEYAGDEISTLRVGSVYTDEKSTHICVSNYTGRSRSLSVFTESGRVDFTIQPSESDSFGGCTEVVIPEKHSLILCYDTTISGKAVQIRFLNTTGKEVLLSKALSQKLLGK